MKYWFAPYELKINGWSVNPLPAKVRQGALIKIEHPEYGIGYGDLHPWVQYGDIPCFKQIQLLKQGYKSAQMKRTLSLAKSDAYFRSQKKSFFEGLEIPESHFLVTDLLKFQKEELDRSIEEGYCALKIKVGKNIFKELEHFKKMADWEFRGVRIRLDFNASQTAGTFVEIIEQFPPEIMKKIEFIEDPIPYDEMNWAKFNMTLPLARDKDLGPGFESELGYKYIILKPARNNVQDYLEPLRRKELKYVITSYMDHPVGQMAAAWQAAIVKDDPSRYACGLLTHRLYENNDYCNQVESKGPKLFPTQGFGVGFDDLLEKEDWKPL